MNGNRFQSMFRLIAVVVTLFCAGAMFAQATAGYSEYYLPGDELNMFYIFDDLDDTGAATGNMHSVTSVVAWSASTTIYYDHWENGYGFDPANPGSTADETNTLATQGASLTFESANIPSGGPPPAARNPLVTCPGQGNPGDRCYDGGDRIFAAGGPVTVTRAVWTELRGVGNQGDAWEIYPVTPQLTTYVLPFGENNYATSATFFTGFQRVYALVQATDDGTTFTVDVDANGTADVLNLNRDATWNNVGDGTIVSLQRGQSFLLDRISACNNHVTCTTAGSNSMNSGVIINGNKTLQVKFVAGRTATTYTARGLSAFPRGFWTNDYYAPYGQNGVQPTRPTDYYLFNPHASALTVNWQSLAGSGSFSIPANSTQSFNRAIGANPSVPVGSGLYFSAAQPFWGVGFGDSTNDLREWGFSLLPTTFLYKEHFLGWSPGSLPLGSAPTNGNGIFLTVAQDNTTVFVDYDNNGTADQTYLLNRLQEQFIPPGPAGDLEGARFWATGDFSMAFGEHASNANTPTPNLDLGYVALPGTDFVSLVLSVDKTANPSVVGTLAGSSTQFTISAKTSQYSLSTVGVVDTLPPNWQYTNNSTTITRPDLTTINLAAANPAITGAGTIANPYVLTWNATQTGGTMQPNQEVLITFTASTIAAAPVGTLNQNRVVATGTRTVGSPSVTQTFTATDFAFVAQGAVTIAKTSNAATPLYPGDGFTYTVTATNSGATQLSGVSLYDALPDGVTSVAGTTTLSRSSVGDSFNSQAYNLNVGTRNFSGNWTETEFAGGTDPAAGNAWITNNTLQFRASTRNVADNFGTAAYTNNNGVDNWASNWTEEPAALDDAAGTVANNQIYINGGVLTLDRSTGNTFAARRTATIPTGADVTISFLPTDAGIDGGESVTAEYQINGAGAFIALATYDGGTGGWSGNVQTFNIANYTGTSLVLRFRATGVWNADGDEWDVDDVNIAYSMATVNTAIARSVSTTGATASRLFFRYSSANLEAGDTLVVEASTAAGGPFTTLTTFTGGVPNLAPPYNLFPYVSGATTVRVRVTGGFDVSDETLSIDDFSITYNVPITINNPPDLLSSSSLYTLAGGENLVATFNVTVDNPFPAGQTSVTNTAATTSVEIPLQVMASVTDDVTTPSLLSATVAGRLWLDSNSNGSQDIGEPGLDNVLVTLKDQFGTPIATTYTDSNGRYLFTGVPAGSGYYVEATDSSNPGGYPAGLTQSFPIGFTNDRTTTFNLAAGQNYTQGDIGYEAAASTAVFGDLVWVDADGDGVRDGGEIGLGGATLTLYRDTNGNGVLNIGVDTLVATTTSALDGSYLFTGVVPSGAGTDDYFVTSSTPGGYTATTPTNVTFLNVVPGNAYLSADFGFLPSAPSFSITDRVWFDANGNGLFSGETGIGGVTIELLDAADNVIGTTVTASDGTFTFSGLPGAGADYTTRISDASNILADYFGTTTYALARERLESNIVANVNRAAAPSYGFNLTRTIGDMVFNDLNANGVKDAGENGFAGVTVSLYSDTNNDNTIDAGEPLIGTVVTDVNGQYLFTGLSTTLAGGRYVVSVPLQSGYNYIAGGRPDSDGATAGIQLAANISGGGAVLDRDFGFQAATPRTISGTLWNDANANGVMNGGETRFQNVSVEVLSSAAGTGTLAVTNNSSTITGTGTTFTNLSPGDPIVVGGVTYRVQAVASNTSLTITENYAGATASGLAWTTRGTVLFTTTTDASGNYSFSGLASANYFVRVTDTNSVLTGFGATWELTEALITLNNPADSIEFVNASSGNVAGIDFGFAQLNSIPTLVKLRVFAAVQTGVKVTLTWQTAYETRNLGFNVYRDVNGTRTKINKDLIAGSTFTMREIAPRSGYTYRFHDVLPSDKQFATYWVEDIETTGRQTLNGPIVPLLQSKALSFETTSFDAEVETDSVTLGTISAEAVSLTPDAGIGVLRPTTLVPVTNAQTTAQLDLASSSALKVYVTKEGWYRITKAQMTAAGFDAGNNPSKLSVYCQGIEQPIVVNTAAPNQFQNADTIEFYGLGLDTPATDARTYWVRKGTPDGLRLGTTAAGGSPLTGSLPFTYQRIDRNVFVTQLVDTGEGENFFGLVVTPNPASETLTVANHDVAAGNATLEITIRGVTENIQHQIQVELNGSFVGTATLNNTQQKTFSYLVAHSSLLAGANTLTLTALSGPTDINVVASARLTYQHLLRADNGLLEVSVPPSRQVTILGFPDNTIRALDITDPMVPTALAVTVAPDGGNFSATFSTPSSGTARTVLVFSSNRILGAPQLALNQPSSWITSKGKADFVIITHKDFTTAATALQNARKAQKMETEVVDIEDIYDESNFGVRSPAAIRSFLQSIKTWKKAPSHVLLLGDASVDPRNYLGMGMYDFVPTKLVPTLYTKTASDGWFADFSDTGVETIAIGRLPVRTASDASLVVGKITARDTTPPSGPWSKTTVMIADVPETWNFPAATASLANMLSLAFKPGTNMISIGSTPSPRNAILNAMNSGSLFVDYVGHGSNEIWSSNMFNSGDAMALTNQNRLPFVVGMTCLNNTFHELFTFSLGEALLLAPNGGAIAVWSSTGLTEPGPQFVMNQELLRNLFRTNTTIGQAILKAKQATGHSDVRRTWVLLGDPTMKLLP